MLRFCAWIGPVWRGLMQPPVRDPRCPGCDCPLKTPKQKVMGICDKDECNGEYPPF